MFLHYVYSINSEKRYNLEFEIQNPIFHMNNRIFLSGIFLLFLFASCKTDNRFKIDTTENVEVTIKRIDKQVLAMDTADILSGINALSAEYPEFFADYVDIWELLPADTTEICQLFREFLTDTMLVAVHADASRVFDDVSSIERKISTGYAYLNHYFPEVKLPEIYFFVAGFNRSLMQGSSFLGIGADLYISRDYQRYKMLAYDYLLYNMDPESIPVDVISTILVNVFKKQGNEDRLLDNMLYQGKILYLLSVFLPDERKENIAGYTSEQLKWCERHEKAIWGTIIDQKDLFSSDYQLVRKYMIDAPFTAPISQESPGRLGAWIGWQIVNSYMQRNQKVSLRDLMIENDSQRLLEQSGYRP